MLLVNLLRLATLLNDVEYYQHLLFVKYFIIVKMKRIGRQVYKTVFCSNKNISTHTHLSSRRLIFYLRRFCNVFSLLSVFDLFTLLFCSLILFCTIRSYVLINFITVFGSSLYWKKYYLSALQWSSQFCKLSGSLGIRKRILLFVRDKLLNK